MAWSLYELSDVSNVGFVIDNVPTAPEAYEFAKNHDLDPLELSLYGGRKIRADRDSKTGTMAKGK